MRWISVHDAIPEMNERVLVCDAGDLPEIGVYRGPSWVLDERQGGSNKRMAYYFRTRPSYLDEEHELEFDYWMPLPHSPVE